MAWEDGRPSLSFFGGQGVEFSPPFSSVSLQDALFGIRVGQVDNDALHGRFEGQNLQGGNGRKIIYRAKPLFF